MKTTIILSLLICATIHTMAQTSVSETTTLAIKYLEGLAGNYPNSLFITRIISEDDNQSIYGIKDNALYEGCRGEARVMSNDGSKFVILIREFSTLEDAEKDMNEMIAAERRYFPSLKAQIYNGERGPDLVEQKVYSDETHRTFLSVADIEKQPGADNYRQFKLITKFTIQ